ncbi:MAG: DUF4383 domain-containing protein [Alphaproteobacteria bacterium]|nr:DUF4383 domain-containing protein [Alphaproteobacteria bacterium]MBV9371113.1 DUF4383 domain-containing protein [Alphaproteobacteria bacterium]MBV9901513.1 DUF4383 domain-containing protein [Alphaproteobacteria bacterium]
MNTRTFAMIFGIVFLLVGALGFVPNMVHGPMAGHELSMKQGYGDLLGLFPVNMLHNIVHLLFGVWGVLAARSLTGSRMYFRAVAVIYALLTVMGLVPMLNTTFGLIPIYGNDVWLHALLAIVAAYFGWMHRDLAADRP